jgi:hypothetical protein
MEVGMLAACQTEPARVERTNEATATVTAIDLPERLVTLRGPKATSSPSRRGMRCATCRRSKSAIAWWSATTRRLPPRWQSPVRRPARARRLCARHPGQSPGAGLAQEVTATVKITDLDLATHTVLFTEPDGLAHTATVQDPEMRDFVETLKVGDEVAVAYTEALAISVEPAGT